jgi:hypothetical protein
MNNPAGVTREEVLAKHTLADAIGATRPFMSNTVGRLDSGAALLSLWCSRSLTWESLEALPETSPALFRKDPDAERGKRLCVSGTIREIRAERTLASRVTSDRALPLIERPSLAAPMVPTSESAPASSNSLALDADPLAPSVDLTIPDGAKVFIAVLETKQELAEGARPGRSAVQKGDPLVAEVIAVKSTGGLVDGSDARACGILTGVTLPASGSDDLGNVTQHRIIGMFDLPENHGGSGEVARHGE